MPGGLLWGDDFDRLRDSAFRVIDRFAGTHLNFVELGCGGGKTSRDLILEITRHFGDRSTPQDFTYYGVDAYKPDPALPFPFTFVESLSHRAIDWVPSEIHWIFVDSCHCKMCVKRDIDKFADLIVVGGEMCFHDAGSMGQSPLGPQNYSAEAAEHDYDEAMKGVKVREVLDTVMMIRPDFRLVCRAPDDLYPGGTEVYEKVAIR